MSPNTPISNLTGNFSPSLSDEGSKFIQVKPQSSRQGNDDIGSLQSIKELKIAKLEGKSVSIGDEQLIKVIEKAKKALEGTMTTLDISIHQKTHEIMVKVIDKDTGETIREIPSEKALDRIAKMNELAGILVDKKA